MLKLPNLVLGTCGVLVLAVSLTLVRPASVGAGPITAVTVDNTNVNPVPVRSVFEGGRQNYQKMFGGTLQATDGNGCVGTFTVPAGKRLVLEHITLSAVAPSQEVLFGLSITDGTNSDFVEHAIAAHRDAGGSLVTASDSLKAFGAPGTLACVVAHRIAGTPSAISVSYSLSGFLVDP